MNMFRYMLVYEKSSQSSYLTNTVNHRVRSLDTDWISQRRSVQAWKSNVPVFVSILQCRLQQLLGLSCVLHRMTTAPEPHVLDWDRAEWHKPELTEHCREEVPGQHDLGVILGSYCIRYACLLWRHAKALLPALHDIWNANTHWLKFK